MQIESNNIAYTGLTKKLSKSIYSHTEVMALVNKNKKSSGIVGHIPNQWVKEIPFHSRKEKIKEFYDDMGQFIEYILPFSGDSKISSVILTQIMKKANIIKNGTNVSLKHVNDGVYAKGYSIAFNNNEPLFFLKSFKGGLCSSLGRKWRHGIACEANSKIYLKSKLNTKEKSFFSNFYYADINNGYYIEAFLPEINSIVKNVSSPYVAETKKRSMCATTGLCQKFHKILKKYGLSHEDFYPGNYKIYKTDKGYSLKCFDLGGLEKYNGGL